MRKKKIGEITNPVTGSKYKVYKRAKKIKSNNILKKITKKQGKQKKKSKQAAKARVKQPKKEDKYRKKAKQLVSNIFAEKGLEISYWMAVLGVVAVVLVIFYQLFLISTILSALALLVFFFYLASWCIDSTEEALKRREKVGGVICLPSMSKQDCEDMEKDPAGCKIIFWLFMLVVIFLLAVGEKA